MYGVLSPVLFRGLRDESHNERAVVDVRTRFLSPLSGSRQETSCGLLLYKLDPLGLEGEEDS